MKNPHGSPRWASLWVAALLASGLWLSPFSQAFEIKIRDDASGNIVLDWAAQTGARYEVLWNPNLSLRASDWQVMTELIASGGTATAVDSGDMGRPHPRQSQSRFYIIRESVSPVKEPTYITEHVSYSTIWGREGSPYLITNEIRVITGATLTIESGVEVWAKGLGALKVEGGLKVLGTQVEPVVFTSMDSVPQPGDWVGIKFADSSVDDACVLSNAVIQYAKRGISCEQASPAIVNSRIERCSEHGIYLDASSPLIEGNAIEYNTQDGIHCYYSCLPRIDGNRIRGNRSVGIRLNSRSDRDVNCLPVINGNTIFENNSYELQTSAYFQPDQVIINARSNWWGSLDPAVIAQSIYDRRDSTGSPTVDCGNWLLSPTGPADAGFFVQGSLMANQTWRLSDSPIKVMANVVVPAGLTLTVEPGVKVLFLGDFRLDVNGTLSAAGTVGQPIEFVSGNEAPWPDDWKGLFFNDTSVDAACLLSHVVVKHAERAVSCYNASPRIQNSRIEENSQQGVYLEGSSPTIQDNVIQNNGGAGIYCFKGSSPHILRNYLWANNPYGIQLEGDNKDTGNNLPLIEYNAFYRNRNYALYTRGYYQPTQTMIAARNNWWGTTVPAEIASLVYDYWDTTSAPLVDYGNWLNTQGGSPVPGNYFHGFIHGNLVWRAADSPISLVGNVIIGTNGSLTIEPGVQIPVLGNFQITVEGVIQAWGSSNAPIQFTSGQAVPARGQWRGIKFMDSSDDAACVLSNTIVEYAFRAIECYDASPKVIGGQIRQNSEHGFYLDTASPLIQRCVITENRYDGIYALDMSSPQVLDNRIENNEQDGIELSSSTTTNRNCLPHILGNVIINNSRSAVYTYNYFLPDQTHVYARSNWWGTAKVSEIHQRIYDRTDSTRSPYVDFGGWWTTPEGNPVAGYFAYGQVGEDLTWRTVDSPVLLSGNIQVLSNATLTIEPGVEVKVMGNYLLEVGGSLQALGQAARPIAFTSAQLLPQAKDWLGIKFLDSSVDTNCQLTYVLIEFADRAIDCLNASPTISHCQLRNNNIGLYLEGSSPDILYNLIEFNTLGVECYIYSHPRLLGNTIALNRQHGLNITSNTRTTDRNPRPIIHWNSIFDNRSSGSYFELRAYNFYQADTVHLAGLSNWWGTVSSNTIESLIYHRPDSVYSPTLDYSPWLETNGNIVVYGSQNSARWFSPNGDGSGDTLTITGFLPVASDWGLMILDANGSAVRTFNGNGLTISEVWDGRHNAGFLVADGRYRSFLQATNPFTGAITRAFGDYSYLDRTSPVGTLAYNPLPDGKAANLLIFQGTASDNVLSNAVLEYGPGLSPSKFTNLTVLTTPLENAVLGQLDSRLLTNGEYTVRLRVLDYAGNLTVTQLVVQVDNVQLSVTAPTPTFFDPPKESTQITYQVDRQCQVTMAIVPIITNIHFMGSVDVTFGTEPVRWLSTNRPAGSYGLTWDGRDASGRLANPGLYGYLVQAEAAHGRVAEFKPEYVPGPVTVSNVVLGAEFDFLANEPLSVSYDLFAPAFMFLAVPNQAYVVYWGVAQDAGHHLGYWDGRNTVDRTLYKGSFTIAYKTQILPENAVVLSHPVGTLIADLQTEAYLIYPSYSQVSEIHYTLKTACEVIIRALDPSLDYILLLGETWKPAGTHVFEWNAHVDAERIVGREGDYEVYVSAYDPVTGIRETRTVNLSIR